MNARLQRLAETGRAPISLIADGNEIRALSGDTLLTALLTNGLKLRRSEFGPEIRAGFCLMAACQDCWVWTTNGERMRACDTPAVSGMAILTEPPPEDWLKLPNA